MLSHTVLTLALATASSAHFILQWPPTAGFNDDLEATAPCGSANVMVNSSSPEVQVDRFAVSIQSSHPQGEWQFRGTLDTEEPYTWTDLTPVVNTTGVGTFCLNYMFAPDDFAGKPGIIQVRDNSADGTLYQCAPVNFVSGANSTIGDFCRNSTSSFTAAWDSMDQISAEPSSSMSMSGSSTSAMASETGGAAAASSTSAEAGAAFPTMAVGSILGGAGALAAGFLL